MYGQGPSTAKTLLGSSRSTGISASSSAAWCRMIGACGSRKSTPTSTTTSQDEIGRNSACTDDFMSGLSATSLRLRRLIQKNNGNSNSAAMCSARSFPR